MLEGEMTLWAGDEPPVKRGVGGPNYALAPHGVPHTYRTGDAGAVYLVTSAPGTLPTDLAAAPA